LLKRFSSPLEFGSRRWPELDAHGFQQNDVWQNSVRSNVQGASEATNNAEAFNTLIDLNKNFDIQVAGPGMLVLAASTVTGDGAGLIVSGGGNITSYGNNVIRNGGTPTTTLPLQ
jgi:hypothetical protein